jgi:hypothetical protein
MNGQRLAERYVEIMVEIRELVEASQRALGPNPSRASIDSHNEICTIVSKFSRLNRLEFPQTLQIQYVQALPCL